MEIGPILIAVPLTLVSHPLSRNGCNAETTGDQVVGPSVLTSTNTHNDYWRDVPLFTALSYGVISVEADVWLNQVEALTPDRTFVAMDVTPLVRILQLQIPIAPLTTANIGPMDIPLLCGLRNGGC